RFNWSWVHRPRRPVISTGSPSAAVARAGASLDGRARYAAPGFTSRLLVMSLLSTYTSCGPGNCTAVHPAGADSPLGAGVSVDADSTVSTAAFASGLACTGVERPSGAAVSSTGARTTATVERKRTKSGFIMNGTG